MELTVNGNGVTVDPGADDTTTGVLRDSLGLTGTKLACGTGVCGACTVLVDGTPAVSCLTPPSTLEGRSVTTVEGLGGTHPVQRAFAAHDALQCGFCTPGFVVDAAAFTDAWRAAHGDTEPSRDEIARAMAGHLCRCGAYPGIYAAIAATCAGRHDGPAETAPPRIEAMEKITGQAVYTTDVRLDGMLDGVIIRSPHAHARVTSVTGAALLVDLLPPDRTVRYVGQPVAVTTRRSGGRGRRHL
jgi:Aerobic-type carbon monoxide dehydrogenase, small subunit CoxS/CutS homologs